MKSVVLLAIVLMTPIAAFAQEARPEAGQRDAEAPALRAHRFTIEAGIVWSGGYDIGDTTAQLRGNGPGPTPPSFTLLTADSRVSQTTGPEFRGGFAITRRMAVELSAALTTPHIGVAITSDAEAPAQELLGEQLRQFIIGAGLTWQLPISMGSKLAPFVSGGGAFLRQLHEDRTLGETGEIYHAGVGARYWLRGGHPSTSSGQGAASRAIGLRGEARINVRRHGIDFENKPRTYPTLSLALFVGL